ncbi:unnamed protein product, partial [Discosporangium mesarthrocarpum]
MGEEEGLGWDKGGGQGNLFKGERNFLGDHHHPRRGRGDQEERGFTVGPDPDRSGAQDPPHGGYASSDGTPQRGEQREWQVKRVYAYRRFARPPPPPADGSSGIIGGGVRPGGTAGAVNTAPASPETVFWAAALGPTDARGWTRALFDLGEASAAVYRVSADAFRAG